jgi:hypothetical protein
MNSISQDDPIVSAIGFGAEILRQVKDQYGDGSEEIEPPFTPDEYREIEANFHKVHGNTALTDIDRAMRFSLLTFEKGTDNLIHERWLDVNVVEVREQFKLLPIDLPATLKVTWNESEWLESRSHIKIDLAQCDYQLDGVLFVK